MKEVETDFSETEEIEPNFTQTEEIGIHKFNAQKKYPIPAAQHHEDQGNQGRREWCWPCLKLINEVRPHPGTRTLLLGTMPTSLVSPLGRRQLQLRTRGYHAATN